MKTITVEYDENNKVFQRWIDLFVALGGQVIDKK